MHENNIKNIDKWKIRIEQHELYYARSIIRIINVIYVEIIQDERSKRWEQ